jgi:hypothetical protein
LGAQIAASNTASISSLLTGLSALNFAAFLRVLIARITSFDFSNAETLLLKDDLDSQLKEISGVLPLNGDSLSRVCSNKHESAEQYLVVWSVSKNPGDGNQCY